MNKQLFRQVDGNSFILLKENNDFSKLSAEDVSHRDANISSDEIFHDETNLKNKDERREVEIAKEILKHFQVVHKEAKDTKSDILYVHLDEIARLANELYDIHKKQ